MKCVIAMLLAVLLALPAMAEANPTNLYMGRWRGEGAELRILPEYQDDGEQGDLALYPIDLVWDEPSGARATWTMTARFNAKAGRLEYADGTRIEGGDITLAGSKGYLKLDGGTLLWTDSRASDSAKLSFTRDMSPAPTKEDFADGYFRVVADLGRSSTDAARRAARTIVQALRFAETHELWNADGEAMQRNLNAAWEMLTEDERARFDAVFDEGVSDPADEAFEDYDALRRVFESAGVGDEMARLASSLEVKLSWEFLSSATLNMFSLDEDGFHEDAVG